MPLRAAEGDQLINPQVMVRRKGFLLAAFQSFGQVLAVCHCTWNESPKEGFVHWVGVCVCVRAVGETLCLRAWADQIFQNSVEAVRCASAQGPCFQHSAAVSKVGLQAGFTGDAQKGIWSEKGPFPVAATADRTE